MALQGRSVYIYINGTRSGYMTKSAKLSSDCDAIEVASATSAQWREFIAGRKSWSISCSWLLPNAAAIEMRALDVGKTVTVKLGNPTYYVEGRAIVEKCDIDATVGNLATGSFSFKGTGGLNE